MQFIMHIPFSLLNNAFLIIHYALFEVFLQKPVLFP